MAAADGGERGERRDEAPSRSDVVFSDPGVGQRMSSRSTAAERGAEVAGPHSFELQNVLGKGSFGEVYQVKHKRTGEVFAMKVLRKQQVFAKNLLRYAMTERNLLSHLRHPFIVSLHYAFQTGSTLVLVLHFCPNGNLSQLIKREGRLPEELAQLYTAEAFLAIEHLHARQVVYRDMKPENVVLDEGKHAMLTDFGLSKEDVADPQGATSFCGSVAYLAPEILAREGHGTALDIYGLGVLLFEMVSGRPPFYSNSRKQLFQNISRATLQAPSSASASCASFILATMRRQPSDRMGAADTVELRVHPFISVFDFDELLRREVPVPQSFGVPPAAGEEAAPQEHEKVQNPFKGRWTVNPPWKVQRVEGWDFTTAADVPTASASEATSTTLGCPGAAHGVVREAEHAGRTQRCRASLCVQRVFRRRLRARQVSVRKPLIAEEHE